LYTGQKELFAFQIKKVEFLKSVDDRLFDKPRGGRGAEPRAAPDRRGWVHWIPW
jgi:hypothetical protein